MTKLTLLTTALLMTFSLTVEAAPPNVVIFLADDAGWGDYGVNGNPVAPTPNIDALAKESVMLEHFYVCPLCAPTRAELLTGRYHLRGGVRGVSTGHERLNVEETTIADSFKAAGYATGIFGKWHNGSQWPYHPMARGFDEYYGHSAGHWGEYIDPPLEHNGRMIRGKGYIVDLCTDQAIDFIERNHEQPFLCYIPFTTPHIPWTAREDDWEKFKDATVPLSATIPERESLPQTRCTMAMMANQDWNVGRVLEKLEERGLSDNTIVLYFSDNGPHSWRWNGGMKGIKGHTDEGGIRSICLFRWPAKLPAGHVVPEIAAAIDLLPTFVSLADIPHQGDLPLDGKDLSPLLLKTGEDWPERNIITNFRDSVTVRSQQYRLDREGKLYDMLADPGQTTPINDQVPEIARQHLEAQHAFRVDVDPLSLTDHYPEVGDHVVDPRPITIGYPEFPVTIMPARDAQPVGTVKRSAVAPNASYFVNWTSTEDQIVWTIDVETTGRYAVTIDYTCPINDAGSLIELSWGDTRIETKVEPGWDPPLYTNQDTLPRPHIISQMKDFRPLSLGTIHLQKGSGQLILQAKEIPGEYVMDLYELTLELLPESENQ